MRRLIPLATLVIAGCHVGHTSIEDPAPGPVSPPTERQADDFAGAANGFAMDLWGELRSSEGNLAVSPASISMALGMVWGGARGRTAEQIASGMHLSEGYHSAAGAVLSTWNDPGRQDYELAVANRLFGQTGRKWQEEFLALTAETYRAPLVPMDFGGSPEPSRLAINEWIASRTKDRIRDLIPQGGILPTTRLVLTNALYFRADWATEFDPSLTRDEPFFTGDGPRTVPTMHETLRARFGRTGGVRVLELSYRGGEVSMLLVLPEARDGLPALEERLSVDLLEKWDQALGWEQVQVAMPRFRMESDRPLSLREPLAALGMTDAFDPEAADFSGIAAPLANGRQALYVDDVLHKAFVQVDEGGTEAAAATAVVLNVKSAVQLDPPKEFTADHPFLFFIRDTASDAILFMGRVTEPS
jgi:serpin B